MKEVVQYLPSMQIADAIGNYVLELDSVFKNLGLKTHIRALSGKIASELNAKALDIENNPAPEGAVHFYHFSTGSSMTRHFLQAKGRKIICYHNITPPEFFTSFDFQTAARLRQGLVELKQMVSATDLALGVSEFNRRHLEKTGYKNTGFIPYSFSPLAHGEKISPSHEPTLLFVGRIAPHKKIEDILRVFACYKNMHAPKARLIVAGSSSGMEKYRAFLDETIKKLSLTDVSLTGRVSNKVLGDYYKQADAFVCMSEHEGICIPLVESMVAGIPVIAFSAAGVPETLGGSGIEFFKKDFPLVAGLIDKSIRNPELRKKLIMGQKEQITRFSTARLENHVKENWQTWTKHTQ